MSIMSKFNSRLFVEWMTEMMKSKGWGVRETAKHAGVSHPIISDILQGQQPSEKTCILLAVLFNVSVEYTLTLGGHLLPRKVDGNPLKKTLVVEVDNLSESEVEEAIRYVRFIKERPNQKKVPAIGGNSRVGND